MWSRVNILYLTKAKGKINDFSQGFISTLAFFKKIVVAVTFLIGSVDGLIGLDEDGAPAF